MSQKGAKKGAGKAEASASLAAVDALRQRIAAEAELIVQETMPRKVGPWRCSHPRQTAWARASAARGGCSLEGLPTGRAWC